MKSLDKCNKGKLSDIADIVMGQSPPGNSCNRASQGIPLLNGPTEFGQNHPSPVQFTTDARKLAYFGDILFCVRGSTTGRMNYADQTYSIGRGLAALRHKSGVEFQPYLKAVIEYHLPILLGSSTGSTFPNVSQEQLINLEIEILPIETQKEIAHILGTLDAKIELNRKMNKTLEEIAQTMFKHWFIDFEFPNDEGMPYKSSGGDMVDSDLGPIPKGWMVGFLSNEYDVIMGQSPPGDTYNEEGNGMPFYQGNADFGTRYPNRRVYCTMPKRTANVGDTLISVRAPVGEINMANEVCCIGRGLCAVRHKSKSISYTYYAMKALSEKFKVYDDGGTVFGCISKNDLASMKIIAIPDCLITAYHDLVRSIDSKIQFYETEIGSLGMIKNKLLTKYF